VKIWNADLSWGPIGQPWIACCCAMKAESINSLLSSRSYKCCLPGHQVVGSPNWRWNSWLFSFHFTKTNRKSLSRKLWMSTIPIYQVNWYYVLPPFDLVITSSRVERPTWRHSYWKEQVQRKNKIENDTSPIHGNVVQPGDDFKDVLLKLCFATKLKFR
jgi:hypothetical protein